MVDSTSNLVIRHFPPDPELSRWEKSRIPSRTHEFEMALGAGAGSFIGRGKIHLPISAVLTRLNRSSEKIDCQRRKLNLIVRLPREPNVQVVKSEHGLSLARYLSDDQGYLVLEVSPDYARIRSVFPVSSLYL